jgi:hypothetical protein
VRLKQANFWLFRHGLRNAFYWGVLALLSGRTTCMAPNSLIMRDLKILDKQLDLKNAVRGTAIICSSIGQCTKTRLNALLVPTAINTVHSYRRLSVGIHFPESRQQANYLVSYWNPVTKLNVFKLSKSPNIKFNFIFRRIGDIHNKVAIRKFSTDAIKKNIKDTEYEKLLNESELFKSDLKKLNSDLWKLYLKADKASTVFDISTNCIHP